MAIRIHCLAWVLLICCFSPPLRSQTTFNTCRDIQGNLVASISDSTVNDIAVARVFNGRPVIVYNPIVVAWTQPVTRLFFYAHECGHHALGHLLQGLRLGQEQEADCWSIRTLVKKGLFSDSDISAVQADIARMGRGDWTHLPGPQRAINLRACLREDDDDSGTTRHSGSRHSDDDPEPRRPRGHWDVVACTHQAHAFDVIPCQHVCYVYGRPFPCHQADQIPCTHPLHPAGDRVWVAD